MKKALTQALIFLTLLSTIGLFGCSSDEYTSPPESDLPPTFRFARDDFKYTDIEKSKEKFLKVLRINTYYDTPNFNSEREKYSETHLKLAKEYIAWRQKNGTSYEDYDFFRFIFDLYRSGFSFVSFEYEHILVIADVAMKINKDIIIFAPDYYKEEFLIRIYYIKNGLEVIMLPNFDEDLLRKSILNSQERNKQTKWCEIKDVSSRIEVDKDGYTSMLESRIKHTINFTHAISDYESEKEFIFEIIAATKIGRKFLPEFLDRVNNNKIIIKFEEFLDDTKKRTTKAGQWDGAKNILSLNSKFIWTYGSMAAVLFHEIIHTVKREVASAILVNEDSEYIAKLETDIMLLDALIRSQKTTGIESSAEENRLNDLKNTLMFYDEVIAYSYQFEFAKELYRISPCTLLHLRTKDVQGLKDKVEIGSRI